VVKKVKDRIESIAGGDGFIAWCGRLLWVHIVVKLLILVHFFDSKKIGQSLV
jgi:hypothetical protein